MTPWTITCQVPLSMEFSGKDVRMGCHFLLQGIFPTQGSNPGLRLCRQILYHLSHGSRTKICQLLFVCFIQSFNCVRLFAPMDCSTPGSSVPHYRSELLKFTCVAWVLLSNHLILCRPFSFCLQSFPASEAFPMSRLLYQLAIY